MPDERSSAPAASAPPLAGVRVVDLSRVLAGPYCTMVLADLGADVVKVERPGEGDETRGWVPPFAGGESAYYLSVNRSKRSCALDLADSAGRELALELCASADAVIENFKVGGAERLGVGWPQLHGRNPALVLCSITGFGSRREPPGRPGYDFVAQAESGLMSITGPERGPAYKVGVALVDVLAGLHAAVAMLAALHRAAATGRGERIEVPLLDAALAGLVNLAQNALVTGEDPVRHGNAHPNIVPYQDFPTASGRIAIAAANDGLFRALCRVIGRTELADDPAFVTNADRVRHRERLVAELERTFATRDADAWVETLDAAGVPVGKLRTVPEALAGAAAAGRPATVAVEHPTAGELELVGSPIWTEGPLAEPAPPPLLGEHTAALLRELGARRGRDRRARGARRGGACESRRALVRLLAGRGGRARLLGQRRDRERAAGGLVQHLGRLLRRARVQLDQHVDHDLVLFVLVEAHVGEELARAMVAEGGEGERVGRVRTRARLDLLAVDGDDARGDPGRAGDHPLPAVLDGLDAAHAASVRLVEAERQVGLVVQAVEALNDGLLHLLDRVDRLARLRVDLENALVVELHLEVLRPAAVAAQPARLGPDRVGCRSLHAPIMLPRAPEPVRMAPVPACSRF
jgi:crotonobetainyl-CoA:carnitine CoA-transferase CaiB-like acyl-CoA transferase